MKNEYYNTRLIKGGKNFYGQPIGILMLDVLIPRLPGDIGNGYTFDFPVRYKVVSSSTAERVILNPDFTLVNNFIEAARELETEGVRAITTSCGYIAAFQNELADAVNVPVFSSSLIQAPMVRRMLRKDQKVCILVADSRTITDEHMISAGIDFPVIFKGSENYPAFYDVFPTSSKIELDYPACRDAVVQMVIDALDENPEIGAVVCEGSNFALFRHDVQRATNIPFFDIVTLTRMIHQAVVPIGLPEGCL